MNLNFNSPWTWALGAAAAAFLLGKKRKRLGRAALFGAAGFVLGPRIAQAALPRGA